MFESYSTSEERKGMGCGCAEEKIALKTNARRTRNEGWKEEYKEGEFKKCTNDKNNRR